MKDYFGFCGEPRPGVKPCSGDGAVKASSTAELISILGCLSLGPSAVLKRVFSEAAIGRDWRCCKFRARDFQQPETCAVYANGFPSADRLNVGVSSCRGTPTLVFSFWLPFKSKQKQTSQQVHFHTLWGLALACLCVTQENKLVINGKLTEPKRRLHVFGLSPGKMRKSRSVDGGRRAPQGEPPPFPPAWTTRVAILGIVVGVLVAGMVARHWLDLKPVAPLTLESLGGFHPPT